MASRWAGPGALLVGIWLAGCASPPRDQPPETGGAPPAVTVLGAQGPVGGRAERSTLGALAAEGRPDLLRHHLRVLGETGDVDLLRGNAARLLLDGPQTFAAMRAAVESARRSVMLQSYIIEDAGVAAEFAELLGRRAREGLRVALMPDALGSLGSAQAFFDTLAEAGVSVCRFNPVNPIERAGSWSLNHRSHRKLLVVDEQIAFTGGINISQVYGSGSRLGSGAARRSDADGSQEGWRDTQIELKGPAAAELAHVFGRTWHGQGCPGSLELGLRTGSLPEAGQRVVKILASDAREPDNRIYQSLLAAVRAARVSVQLTMAYFAPGEPLVQALAEAARRGVAVELVLPGRSDSNLVLNAGRSYYDRLLSAGVRIYELQGTVLHAKTALVDGVWSSVGSSNLDWRSLALNDELNVVVLGEDFGDEMAAMFANDRGASKAIALAQWRQRGLGQRLKEGWAQLFERWL